MLKTLISSLALAVTLSATSADAEENLVVVELFTSQGCSSCPPADALLHQLAQRDGVLPLAMHVDYWDYIGWKDLFADPSHTKRQKAYAHVAGRNMIYTPQMVIGGVDDVVGADAMKVLDLIDKHRAQAETVGIRIDRRESGAGVTLTALKPMAPEIVIQLVRYAPRREVSITRGELAGHTMTYGNIVEDLDIIEIWDGQGTLEFDVDLPAETSESLSAAILVQRTGYGQILAAAKLD
ncbi:MAG: DUF1223 domain-containing protein [Rhodobacteraceae bacterium]|nr:DUF1223 domain-containing protein [Paracoccaceae bacterium]